MVYFILNMAGFIAGFDKIFKEPFGVTINFAPFLYTGAFLLILCALFFPSSVWTGLSFVIFFSPLWLPFLLFVSAKELWLIYVRSKFIHAQDNVVLELLMPREVMKSPLAMEAVLSGLHQGPGEGDWYSKWVAGKVRPWWSFEMVSMEGKIHFYVWTRKSFAPLVRAQFYAQYPDMQIIDVPDYAFSTDASPHKMKVWGCQFALTQPDPYPIKTYVDYGLDQNPKEEFRIDPLSNVIEFLGAIKKGEQIWIQIMFRVTKKEKHGDKDWKKEGQDVIKEIMEEGSVDKDEEGGGKILRLTEGQKDKIKAIERNTAKLGFDVGIRALYIAEPDAFSATNISGITAVWKQFSSENLNGFKPSGGMTAFKGYPWEDKSEKKRNEVREGLAEAYKYRGYFHHPYQDEHFVLSTEELATIFRPPSKTVATAALARIPSLTVEAPPNLPI